MLFTTSISLHILRQLIFLFLTWQYSCTTILNVKGHELNEEDISLPSHVAKIGDKSGGWQQCMVSQRFLTNKTQGISDVTPQKV